MNKTFESIFWGIHFMHPEFGRPRITDELNENGYLINHKKVYRLIAGAVLHSDSGFQYTSKLYSSRLEDYGIKGSHSRKGNCLDNACVESFFSHLKTEKLYINKCKSEEELEQALEDYIYHYNYKRRQKKLKKRAPIEYRHAFTA